MVREKELHSAIRGLLGEQKRDGQIQERDKRSFVSLQKNFSKADERQDKRE